MPRGHKIRTKIPFYAFQKPLDDGSVYEDIDRFEDGTPKVVNIDQFSGQPFMENANGFIMNDIMAFEEAQSDSVARAIIQRTQMIKTDSLPQDMSIRDCFDRVIPHNLSSPAELVRYEQTAAKILYEKQVAAKKLADQNEKVIDFTETPPTKEE